MNERFRVHKLNPAGLEKATRLAGAFNDLLATVTEIAGDQTYRSVRMYDIEGLLEHACFLAKKEIACKQENQEPGL